MFLSPFQNIQGVVEVIMQPMTNYKKC